MKLSIGILTHNEAEYVSVLFPLLQQYINDDKSSTEYEVVIVDDYSTDLATTKLLMLSQDRGWKVLFRSLNNDFAAQKNFLTENCTGDWILNLDADESISQELFNALLTIVENNVEVEAYRFPRLNTVNGLTEEHIKKWNWRIEDVDGIQTVCWPDYQMRLYKNLPQIRWKNKVHEVLDGFKVSSTLPTIKEFAIIHHKDISRQEQQNEKYEKIMKAGSV